MQASRSLPSPSQQQSANLSQPSPVSIRATLRYQKLYIPGHDSDHTHPLSAYNYNSIHPDLQGIREGEQYQHVYPPGPSSSVPCCATPLSIPQTISPAESSSSSSSSYSHTNYLPAAPTRVEFDPSMPINASDHLFSSSPTTVQGPSGGIGIDEDEQRKSTPPKVCPASRSKGSKARKVHVSSGSTSTTSMFPLSDLLVPAQLMPPVQVQANQRGPAVVSHRRLQRDDSVQPSSSSLPLSVPASTSSVPQSPKDKDKDSTSPTTSTPTPAPFFRPSGRSRVNSKVRPKPSTTDPFPTPFKGLRRLIGITKEPDKGKQREQDKQVEDLSSSWCLVGSRATDRDRMGAENVYGGEHPMETGGKWRAGSYPLDPFDAVLLDQYVFTLFYC